LGTSVETESPERLKNEFSSAYSAFVQTAGHSVDTVLQEQLVQPVFPSCGGHAFPALDDLMALGRFQAD
jgi:hypothetical protein